MQTSARTGKAIRIIMKNQLIKLCCICLVLAAFLCYNTVTSDRIEAEESAQAKASAAEEARAVNTNQGAGYLDGKYTGSAQGYGGTVTVEVTIQKGSITEIEAISHAGEDAAYWNMCSGVIPQLIESQGAHADTVSGATFSSSGIINATVDALEKAVHDGEE